MLTFADVDWFVCQWAAWTQHSADGTRKLGAAMAKWQMDYRAPFDPENEAHGHSAAPVDEDVAIAVDRIMAAMTKGGHASFRAYRVLLAHSVHGDPHNAEVLDRAIEQFRIFFDKVLDIRNRKLLTSARGCSAA